MKIITIKKGKDISLKGLPQARLEEAVFPERVAVKPTDFCGLKPRLLVKEGDAVKVGSPVVEDKQDSRIKIPSPASGVVAAIRRGEKRALLEMVIQSDGRQDAQQHTRFSPSQLSGLFRQQIIDHLLDSGAWSFLRQRPFDHIADPSVSPKAIFVKAIDTNPLAGNMDLMLEGKEEDIQAGLGILSKMTDGPVYLCISPKTHLAVLREASAARVVTFEGPHPAGNVGTHIHYLAPLDKGDRVWYLDIQDVAALARTFLTGCFCPDRMVVIGGEGANDPLHRKTIRGASLKSVVAQESYEGLRVISGSVLIGQDVGPDGFLGFYDTQVSLIPLGGRRQLLGWATPGWKKFSFSHAFASILKPHRDFSIDSAQHGSNRAIVMNDLYDRYVALDVMTFFLMRAIFAGEIDEMERLGILECSPEDFALASFVCPSKTDVCGIIRQGLELMEREG